MPFLSSSVRITLSIDAIVRSSTMWAQSPVSPHAPKTQDKSRAGGRDSQHQCGSFVDTH